MSDKTVLKVGFVVFLIIDTFTPFFALGAIFLVVLAFYKPARDWLRQVLDTLDK